MDTVDELKSDLRGIEMHKLYIYNERMPITLKSDLRGIEI